MEVALRRYNHPADFGRVGQLLMETYRTEGGHVNWLQPRWEYMHFHPLIGDVDLESIGVWEADGEIVAVAHPEHRMGLAYFQISPPFEGLKGEMLAYAEARLSVVQDGIRRLSVLINDDDQAFQRLARRCGYSRSNRSEPMSLLAVSDLGPPAPPPRGYRVKTLAEDNDLREVDRVLWRGFGHGAEPPPDGIQDRKFMQSAPHFRKDLNVVVEAPSGHFVSYCGMWYEPVNALAYVEPVATDPDYRRMGLGRAVVLEGVRRCGALGAEVAYVGSAMRFYASLGFRQVYNRSVWERSWSVDS